MVQKRKKASLGKWHAEDARFKQKARAKRNAKIDNWTRNLLLRTTVL